MDVNKKGAETLLVMLYSTCSGHLGNPMLCLGYHSGTGWTTGRFNEFPDTRIWGRTNAMEEILDGLGMYCPERTIHHNYSMKYLRDHTQKKIIWSFLFCSV